ncbi:MAG: DUF1294 domain-containing protein [Parasporobacterium sp.]|nr:DUF1294 domain-containing protein [Parasporobacterium sp.]
MNLTGILLLYLALLNLAGFLIMGADKKRAVRGRWRIPEKTFFILSAAGGSLGCLTGMYLFHHKTKHWYFVVFIPLILAAQGILALVILIL